jgi:hypothetical protein
VFLGIKLEGWLTIAAIILGPLLAFFVQSRRDKKNERERSRKVIFGQLLLTLRAPMAPKHVDALNSIPLEFYSDSEVMEAWRLYSSHLNDAAAVRANNARWVERKFELLVDLTAKMATAVGYKHIDRATLRDNVYVPQGYQDIETQTQQMRAALLQVLNGQRPVPVTTVGPVNVEGPIPLHGELPNAPQPQQPQPHQNPPALPPANDDD